MSGGSLNYLCYRGEAELLFGYIHEMEDVEHELLKQNAPDIARDVRRLIEYIESARIRIEMLAEQLHDIFHAVEWYQSADTGLDSLRKSIENYRNGTKEEK